MSFEWRKVCEWSIGLLGHWVYGLFCLSCFGCFSRSWSQIPWFLRYWPFLIEFDIFLSIIQTAVSLRFSSSTITSIHPSVPKWLPFVLKSQFTSPWFFPKAIWDYLWHEAPPDVSSEAFRKNFWPSPREEWSWLIVLPYNWWLRGLFTAGPSCSASSARTLFPMIAAYRIISAILPTISCATPTPPSAACTIATIFDFSGTFYPTLPCVCRSPPSRSRPPLS